VHYSKSEQAAKYTVALIEAAGGSAFALQADLAAPHAAETLWTAFDEHADGVDVDAWLQKHPRFHHRL
jgi:hypothetical protein